MPDQTVILDRLQVKRTKVSGRRPEVLADGEEFINHADKFRLIGDGVTHPDNLPAYPLRPGIDDVFGLRQALDNAAVKEPPPTPVNDTDYQCLATDRQVGMVALTAPRTIYLPDVDAYPFRDLVIADETGVCSDTLTITILPGPTTSDVIGVPDGALVLFTPYQAVTFKRGASDLWIRL